MVKKEKYLKLGLIALSNCTKFGSWFYGHVGAEILTNTFFLSEFQLSKDTEKAIITRIEFILSSKSHFFESEFMNSNETSSKNEIEKYLEQNLKKLSTAGHGVIYATLALKTIKLLNGWLPTEIKKGIIELQLDAQDDLPNRYFGYHDYQNQTVDCSNIPKFENPKEVSKYCLLNQDFYESREIDGVHYFFSGNQLHDITHSQALFMLTQLGYHEYFKIGIQQLRKQIKLGQTKPPNSKFYRSKVIFNPLGASFWRRQISDEHHNKLAYSVAYLLSHINTVNKDEVLAKVSGHWELMN